MISILEAENKIPVEDARYKPKQKSIFHWFPVQLSMWQALLVHELFAES